MLQGVFVLIQQYRLPIYILVAVSGLVCYGVSEHIVRKEKSSPGSIVHCREITLSLNIAAFILMVSAMIALFLGGYYDEFLGRLFS